jgi:threonine/homoserine/homoserine lactone efflux protein
MMPDFAAFLTYAVVVSFTPGPNNILSMSFAAKLGYRKTLHYIAGVFVGFFLIMLSASYLNLCLTRLLPAVSPYLRIGGAVYVLFLMYKVLTSRPGGESKVLSKLCSFPAGVGLQFLNVKGILYGLTVTATFILPFSDSLLNIGTSAVLLAGVAISGNILWALFGTVFQVALAKHYKVFNGIMGLLLLYVALSILGWV